MHIFRCVACFQKGWVGFLVLDSCISSFFVCVLGLFFPMDLEASAKFCWSIPKIVCVADGRNKLPNIFCFAQFEKQFLTICVTNGNMYVLLGNLPEGGCGQHQPQSFVSIMLSNRECVGRMLLVCNAIRLGLARGGDIDVCDLRNQDMCAVLAGGCCERHVPVRLLPRNSDCRICFAQRYS